MSNLSFILMRRSFISCETTIALACGCSSQNAMSPFRSCWCTCVLILTSIATSAFPNIKSTSKPDFVRQYVISCRFLCVFHPLNKDQCKLVNIHRYRLLQLNNDSVLTRVVMRAANQNWGSLSILMGKSHTSTFADFYN